MPQSDCQHRDDSTASQLFIGTLATFAKPSAPRPFGVFHHPARRAASKLAQVRTKATETAHV